MSALTIRVRRASVGALSLFFVAASGCGAPVDDAGDQAASAVNSPESRFQARWEIDFAVNASWASPEGDLWLVGNDRDEEGSRIARCSGKTCEYYDPPAFPADCDPSRCFGAKLRAIWGSSSRDIWVGGSTANGGSWTLRYDGRSWNIVTYPKKGARSQPPIEALWGSTPNDVWTTDGYHYDGRAWAPPMLGRSLQGIKNCSGELKWQDDPDRDAPCKLTFNPSPLPRAALWGAGPDAVWMGGENNTIVRWDGKAWEVSTGRAAIADAAGRPQRFDWVNKLYDYEVAGGTERQVTVAETKFQAGWALSKDRAWAVANHARFNGTGATRAGFSIVELDGSRPNGSQWKEVLAIADLPGSTKLKCNGDSNDACWLYAMKGRAAHDIWAVGENIIVHHDGKTWHTLDVPTYAGRKLDRLVFKAVEFGPRGEVWLVADYALAAKFYEVGEKDKTGTLVFEGR